MNLKEIFVDDIGAFRDKKSFLLKAHSVGPPIIVKSSHKKPDDQEIENTVPRLTKYDGMEINAYALGEKISQENTSFFPIIFCHVDIEQIRFC